MSHQQKITILNSRQGLYPCRSHIWIQNTQEALESTQNSHPIILSSVGMSTWYILTIATSQLQLPLKLYLQKTDKISEEQLITKTIRDYNLNPKLVTFQFIDKNSSIEFQTRRDKLITSSADIIFPISVRENGNLTKLISQHSDKINTSFQIPYKSRKEKIAYTLEQSNIRNEMYNITDSYIIHWTKAHHHKWYHERQFDYYTDILNSDSYLRTAINSLHNIIEKQNIFATPNHMPQEIPTVSFSSLSPIEMLPLFKWRSRYREMSFEPYGIGIKRSVALKNNIREVFYYDKKEKHAFSQEDIWLTQSKGIQTNWEAEKEYRHLGNFNFTAIAKEDILLFTRYKKETDQLQKLTGYKSISFLD